eukprot:UN11646
MYINDGVIKIVRRSENCKINKKCPYPTSEAFSQSKEVFYELLLSTPLVIKADEIKNKATKNGEYYGYQITSKGKLKDWIVGIYMLVDNRRKCTILITCMFIPEKQLKRDGKYMLINEWNQNRRSNSRAYIKGGNIELEREFSFNKDWDFGHIYPLFSNEVSFFLKKIDLFRDTLRKTEDDALKNNKR